MLNKHVPLKKKVLHANHAPYLTKGSRKAIIKGSCLEEHYLKVNRTESLRNYKKHLKFCSRSNNKECKHINIDDNKFTDNKAFW